MLTVVTWLWGTKYSADYPRRLVRNLRRHLDQPFHFVFVTDQPDSVGGADKVSIPNPELIKVKGCFARLRMFDPEWQKQIDVHEGDRVVCIDLDVIPTGNLDVLFNRPEPFLILQGANASNPCPYNGSLWMFRAGYRPDVWTDFSLKAAAHTKFYEFPDDQGWFAHKLPGEAGWKVGSPSGVYAFHKPGWPKGDDLPADARMVVFPGWRDPSKFTHLPWVKEHWL